MARRYEEAAAECRKRLEVNPAPQSARARLAETYVELGRCGDAMLELQRMEESGAPPGETHAYVYARCGRPRDARRLDPLRSEPRFQKVIGLLGYPH
jgi:predicted Zn-dependent protease